MPFMRTHVVAATLACGAVLAAGAPAFASDTATPVPTSTSASRGATSAPSLSAGRYVSRGVFVGAKQGATPGTSAATVEIELTPNIKVETDVGADSKAGVNFEWNY